MGVTAILTTVDQVPGAATVPGPQLSFRVGTVTAREIVRARVLVEVDRHNSELEPRPFLGLIEAPQAERELNGPRGRNAKPLDVDSQIEVALEAVRRGRVIILFNGEQVSDLDAPPCAVRWRDPQAATVRAMSSRRRSVAYSPECRPIAPLPSPKWGMIRLRMNAHGGREWTLSIGELRFAWGSARP